MNRELQTNMSRRSASRKTQRGGGYGMGAPLVPIPTGPGSDWNFTVKEPVNQGYDDCLFPARPGQLFNTPDPALAQAGWPLKGGKRSRRVRRGRKAQRGGGLRADDITVGREFFFYDPSINEIHKHRIEAIEGDTIRTVRDFGAFTEDIALQLSNILGDDNYDTQLVILQGDHPDAVLSFTESYNNNNNADTVIAPPAPPPLVHSNAMVFGNAGQNVTPEGSVIASNNQGGGSYDEIEMSHAYRHNGWNQELSHGASPATSWGRDTGLIQTIMAGGGVDPIEASHAYPPNGWETPSTHGGQAPQWGPQTGLAQTPSAGGRRRRRTARKQRGAGCGCTGSRLFGGGARHRRASSRRQRGGAPSRDELVVGTRLFALNNLNEIDEYEIVNIVGNEIRLRPIPSGIDSIYEIDAIVNNPHWDTQYQELRSRSNGSSPPNNEEYFNNNANSWSGGRRRKQRGGANYGYAIDPSVSIGGSGPNVDALRTGVPCDPRPGSIDSSNPQLPLDPRAYGVGYSATPNTTVPSLQAGGAYSTGNAFPDSCYKAPGSELPVYNAQTAGFNFYPSTAHNGTLPDGITPYNDVVPYAARMGGARRKTRKGRKGRKDRKDRKGRKDRKSRAARRH
jgi:hypothetical protein